MSKFIPQTLLSDIPDYFTLEELESIHGPLGLAIERDLWFKPTLFSNIQKNKA
jgi:hypothetical protein